MTIESRDPRRPRLPRLALQLCLAGSAAAIGCAPREKVVVIHPEGGDAARAVFDVAMIRPITLPDNFVLRPDEFAAVGVDHERGVIYAGSRDGTLLALEQFTGDVVWEMQMGASVSSRPTLTEVPGDEGAAAGEVLLVGTDNGELVAIDPDTHDEVWRYQTDGKIRNEPVSSQGVVYFVNTRDQVFALDVRTGDWRWQYEQELQSEFTINGHAGLTLIPPSQEAAAAGRAGTLYAGFDNGKVVSIGAGTGEALWIASVAPPGGGQFSDCDSTPLVDPQRGVLFVAGQQTGVYSLSLDDGSVNWSFPVRGVGSVIRGRGSDLIAASSLEGVLALTDEGLLVWKTQTDPGVVSTPVLVDAVVYATHSSSGLLAFDAETGQHLARIDPGSGMSSVPIFDEQTRRFYATTNRGLLLALQIDPVYPDRDPT